MFRYTFTLSFLRLISDSAVLLVSVAGGLSISLVSKNHFVALCISYCGRYTFLMYLCFVFNFIHFFLLDYLGLFYPFLASQVIYLIH